tara:strand:+ start:81 stop:650 length:570 start_codon:yes stop_codon:yes gene_type:complete
MDKEQNEKKYKKNGIWVIDRWLLKSFVENLKKEGYSIKRLLDDYVYIGGSGYYSNDHTDINNEIGFESTPQSNYYTRHWEDWIGLDEIYGKRPDTNKCICGHDIHENCWLMNTINRDIAPVIGNCCIKNFLPELKIRKCNLCNKPHKRIVYDICFECDDKKKILARNKKIKEKAKLKKSKYHQKYLWKL